MRSDIAVAGDGALRSVWTPGTNSTSAMTLLRPPGGPYSSDEELGALNVKGGLVAGAADGFAIAAWQDGSGVKGAVAPAGGTFGPEFTVALNARLDDLDVAANGAAIVTFEQGSAVNVSYRPPGGSFGPAEPVSDPVTNRFDEVTTAIDATGDAAIAWIPPPNGGGYLPEIVFRAASTPVDPSDAEVLANDDVQHLDLAMNDNGDTAIAWYPDDFIPRVRYRRADGSLGAQRTLSGTDVNGVRVAVDDAGNVLVVWCEACGTSVGTPTTQWSFGASGAVFSSAATFPGGNGALPDVEFWPDGDALAVWPDASDSGDLYSAIRPAGGSWGPQIPVLDAPGRIVTNLKLVTDPAGNAALTWTDYDGFDTPTETEQAFVKGFDGALPVLRNLTVTGSARPGQTLDLSVDGSDVWSSVGPVKWDFGDGGSATGSAVQHAYSAAGDYEVGVSATDGLGQTATATRTVHVSTGPKVRRFHLTHEVFRLGRRKTPVSVSAKVHRGTKFVFKSSEAGRAKLTIQKRKRGHWRTRRPRLKRLVTEGKNRIRFTGRYGDRVLKPGRYRVKLRVKDADGNKSSVKKARFRVVR